jgi:hypothetical protein
METRRGSGGRRRPQPGLWSLPQVPSKSAIAARATARRRRQLELARKLEVGQVEPPGGGTTTTPPEENLDPSSTCVDAPPPSDRAEIRVGGPGSSLVHGTHGPAAIRRP